MTLVAGTIAEAEPAPPTMALGGGTRTAYVVVLIAVIASLYPFGSLIVTSILPPLNGTPGLLWVQLFQQLPVGTYMLNSTIVSAARACTAGTSTRPSCARARK